MADKTITLDEILTQKELDRAIEIYHECLPGTFAKVIADELIEPKIEEINKKTGQENDPMFLAYAVESVLMQPWPGDTHAN